MELDSLFWSLYIKSGLIIILLLDFNWNAPTVFITIHCSNFLFMFVIEFFPPGPTAPPGDSLFEFTLLCNFLFVLSLLLSVFIIIFFTECGLLLETIADVGLESLMRHCMWYLTIQIYLTWLIIIILPMLLHLNKSNSLSHLQSFCVTIRL